MSMGSQANAWSGCDPYLSLNWWVQVENVVVAQFAECSGLTVETEFYEYREGGVNTYMRKFPGPTKYTNLVLKRGLTDNDKLFEWYKDVIRLGLQATPVRKTISVMLYQYHSQEPVRTWTFINAFPVKWVGPELRADQSQVAIETLEFAHEGLSFT